MPEHPAPSPDAGLSWMARRGHPGRSLGRCRSPARFCVRRKAFLQTRDRSDSGQLSLLDAAEGPDVGGILVQSLGQ